MREIEADIDAAVAHAEARGIPAGVARALVLQLDSYNMDLSRAENLAQMAQDAAAANAESFADGSGFRDSMIRAIRGAAAFRTRILEMTTEAEGGDRA